jgi:hypothetical protein
MTRLLIGEMPWQPLVGFRKDLSRKKNGNHQHPSLIYLKFSGGMVLVFHDGENGAIFSIVRYIIVGAVCSTLRINNYYWTWAKSRM